MDDNQSDSERLLRQCEVLESEMAALRARYDQYFLGVERSRPSVAHNALKKKIDALSTSLAKNAVVRFRVQNLHQKWLAYERQWVRIGQEMENGTYHRDLFKARMHAKKKP